MSAARPSPAQIAAALSAWTSAGLPVGRMTIRDGAVILEVPDVAVIPEKPQPAKPKAWRTG